MKKLILTMILLGITTNTHAGADGGGGGGGFCYAGKKCVTLAEAGFRVENYATTPVISVELFNEINSVIDSLILHPGFKDSLKQMTAGNPGTFKKVISYNPKGLKKIKKEYEQLLATNNMSSEQLIIYAVSDRQNTYLLPEFEQLNLRSKALILIHEGKVRSSGSVLEALRLDGAILDALNGQMRSVQIADSIIGNYNKKYAGSEDKESYLLTAFVTEYNLKTNNYMQLNDLLPKSLPTKYYEGRDNNLEGDKYCMTAADEANFYQNYNSLWQAMSKHSLKCFYVGKPEDLYQSNSLVKQQASAICSKIKDGNILTTIDYKSSLDSHMANRQYANSFERAPRVLLGLYCKGQEVDGISEIELRSN